MTRERLFDLAIWTFVIATVALLFLGVCTDEPAEDATVVRSTATATEHAFTATSVAYDASAYEVPTTRVPVTVRASRKAAARTEVTLPTSEQTATNYDAGSVEAAICEAFGDQCAKAVAVARCESGLRPWARNGPHVGLFQVNVYIHGARIHRMGFSVAQMVEAGPNIAVARALWLEQGWRPWTCA